MKKLLVIACLTAFSLTMWGFENTTHDFETAYSEGQLEITNNIVGTMNDGTTYTCSTGARFNYYGDYLSIELPNNKEFVVSPSRERLREIYVYHFGGNIVLNIFISSDGSTWAPITGTDFGTKSGYVKAINLNGDYYVKVVNASGSTQYIRQIIYYTEPCHCLQVVSE